MPANRKAGREEIIKAALAVLRRDGFEAVNARSVAKELGCSTQPIYHSFRNMEDLKAELTAKAAEAHAERVRAFLSRNDGSHSHYCDYGLGFVRFAEQEKQLFRWLYLKNTGNEPRQADVLLPEILRTISEEYGYDEATARKLHSDMVFFAYGLAILANTGGLRLSEEEIVLAFQREFLALSQLYEPPSGQPRLTDEGNSTQKSV